MKPTLFIVPGEPVGKARPRVTKWGAYTPEKTVLYENLIKTCYNGKVYEGAVGINVRAFYSIPKSASKKARLEMESFERFPTKKPDCDNVLKIIGDALNGVAYKDDSQIVKASIEKYYSDEPRVEIELMEITTPF
jgi:Holliday junction resolvase RusA-like endonuclease